MAGSVIDFPERRVVPMPLDAACPRCRQVFPITEAREAVGVQCPGCEAELSAEFRKRSTPEPGQHHYELVVSPGRPIGAGPSGVRKLPLPDDDEESGPRRGGGMGIVVFAGVGTLVLALVGLATTGYLLFSNLDTSDSTISNLSKDERRGGSTPNGRTGPVDGRSKLATRPGPTPPRSRELRDRFQPPTTRQDDKRDEGFDLNPVPGKHQTITPPAIDLKSPVTVPLPGPAEAVTVGGNGRYIVLHVPTTQQLVVFDASRGSIVATEKVPDSGRLFLAGGQNRVVTCEQTSRILRSYTLPDLRKEFDFTSPLSHPPDGIAMGSAVNSPLLISDPFANVALIELSDRRATVVEASKTEHSLGLPKLSPNPRAIPNGNLFLFSRANNPGERTGLLTVQERRWKARTVDLTAASSSADGRFLLGFGQILDAGSGRRIGNRLNQRGSAVWYVGGTSGRSFLRLAQTQHQGKSTVLITSHDSPQSVERDGGGTVIGILPETEGLIDWLRGVPVQLDKHLFLIPDAKLLVVLPSTKDRLVLRKVDVR